MSARYQNAALQPHQSARDGDEVSSFRSPLSSSQTPVMGVIFSASDLEINNPKSSLAERGSTSSAKNGYIMMKTIVTCLLASIPSIAASAGWTALPNTKLQTVCPGGIPGSCAAEVYAWSGATADTQRNRLIIWGGGHNDYYGNEVYALDLSSLSATQATGCGANNC